VSLVLAGVVFNKNVPSMEVDHWNSNSVQKFSNLDTKCFDISDEIAVVDQEGQGNGVRKGNEANLKDLTSKKTDHGLLKGEPVLLVHILC